MKQEDLMLSLAKMMFPSELLDYFSLVHITETPTDVVFHLEERDVLQNPLPGHKYEKNSFYEAARINDFPLRDRRVTLNVKRRRWIDRTTGKSVGNTYELTAKGTRHSKEFAAFLKRGIGINIRSVPEVLRNTITSTATNWNANIKII